MSLKLRELIFIEQSVLTRYSDVIKCKLLLSFIREIDCTINCSYSRFYYYSLFSCFIIFDRGQFSTLLEVVFVETVHWPW